MARRNEREGTAGGGSSSRARKGGTRKAAGSTKAAGSRKTSSRKAAGSRKSAGARKGGARKQASRKNARGKSEAQETAGARPSRSGSKQRAPVRTRTSTRRAASRTGGRGAQAGRGPSRSGDSASAARALWIESPAQHAERPGQTLATRDHDVIRQWAEERRAVPATIAGTEHDGRPGVLRFDFPNFGQSGGRLRQVDWDEWFETFDQRKLVFLFQEQMKGGNQSNFFRLDSPDREEG